MQTLALNILDIVQNSIMAESKYILISIIIGKRFIEIIVKDDGNGITEENLQMASDPFYTTKNKKVGLGLSLFKEMAEECDGKFSMTSELKKGTTVRAVLTKDSVNRAPMGDLAEILSGVIALHPTIRFCLDYSNVEKAFCFDWFKVKEAMNINLDDYTYTIKIKKWLSDNIETINGGTEI